MSVAEKIETLREFFEWADAPERLYMTWSARVEAYEAALRAGEITSRLDRIRQLTESALDPDDPTAALIMKEIEAIL